MAKAFVDHYAGPLALGARLAKLQDALAFKI